jgi:photosystem II stability/assembly factor-like uncharacterized protein
MSWKSSGKFALIGLLSTLIASGCGSLSQLTGGPGGGRTGRSTSGGALSPGGRSVMRQVGTFTGSVNGQTGQITLRPDRPAGASTRSTGYGPGDALSLTGTGTPASGGILRGNVTLASNNPVQLLDVKAVLLSISTSSVAPNNATGTTSASGTSRPYWSYGNLDDAHRSVTRTWEFRNSSAVSFTFRVAIYANTWTYTTADGGTLSASSFVSASTGWAVGDGGKILKTTDGGASWSVQNAGTSSNLKDVSFVSATQGWAVGADGEIIATSDGGRTWRHQQATTTDPGTGFSVPVSVNLYGVKFVSATKGVAVGDAQTILLTTNGGTTWQQVFGGSSTGALYDVCFVNASSGWAVGTASTILHTTDGGSTWTPQTVPASQRPNSSVVDYLNILQAVYFVDSNNGWAVGVSGWVLNTTDGGATWTWKKITNFTRNLFSVFFANSTTGWAAGAQGQVVKTTNGGASWTITAPTSFDLMNVTGLAGNVNNLWAAGRGGLTLYSTNGGGAWTRPGTASTTTYNTVWFSDSAHGWVVGDSSVALRTVNGGATWTSIRAGSPGSALQDVQFINANEGWVVGQYGTLVHTTDGGQTWGQQDWSGLHLDPSISPPMLYGVRFLDAQNGWACGSASTLLRTTDGGVTWEDVIPPIQSTYRKIARPDLDRGWIVGSGGVIIATFDGGESWNTVDSGTSKNLNNIDAVATGASLSVWAVGDGGTLLHSQDGTTWERVDLGLTEVLNGVDFLPGGLVGWVAGNNGLLLRTTDGGANWSVIDPGTNSSLKSVRMISADEGWIAGLGSTLKLFR